LEDGAADTLIKCSEGDLRKAITFLQSAARLVGAVSVKKDPEEEDAMDIDKENNMVTVKSIEDIAGVIPDETIEKLVKAMHPRSKGIAYEAVSKVVTDMVADGWSGTQVVSQVSCPGNHMRVKLIPFSSSSPSSTTNQSRTYRRTRSLSFSLKRISVLLMVLTSILRFWIWH
jgi:replication factor C subunit 2/4